MLVTKKMPGVSECTIEECAYNISKSCHAIAITIGDGDHPMCDTFFKSTARGGAKDTAGVGACKVSACRHNKDFECSAAGINVGSLKNHGNCLTFVAL